MVRKVEFECGVYAITHLGTGRRYIGSSRAISERIATHERDLKKGAHVNQRLQNAWNKYREEEFEASSLYACSQDVLLAEEERIYLELKSVHGREALFNVNENFTAPPDCTGRRRTEEEISKMRGRRHSEETKAKMREARKGRRLSPESIAKMAASLRGKKHSEETKAKMSESRRGGRRTPEQRARMSAAMKGVKHGSMSAEHKAKLSAALKGRPKPRRKTEGAINA